MGIVPYTSADGPVFFTFSEAVFFFQENLKMYLFYYSLSSMKVSEAWFIYFKGIFKQQRKLNFIFTRKLFYKFVLNYVLFEFDIKLFLAKLCKTYFSTSLYFSF